MDEIIANGSQPATEQASAPAPDGGECGPDELPPQQAQAVLALINQPTTKQAADQAKVSERTLHRWMEDPKFMSALRKARRLAFLHAVSLAQQYTALAVNALAKIITDPTASHASKGAAASTLLKFGREAMGLDDLDERIDALERIRKRDIV